MLKGAGLKAQAPTRWCTAQLVGTHAPTPVSARPMLPRMAASWHGMVRIGRAMHGDLQGMCVSGRQVHVPVCLRIWHRCATVCLCVPLAPIPLFPAVSHAYVMTPANYCFPSRSIPNVCTRVTATAQCGHDLVPPRSCRWCRFLRFGAGPAPWARAPTSRPAPGTAWATSTGAPWPRRRCPPWPRCRPWPRGACSCRWAAARRCST